MLKPILRAGVIAVLGVVFLAAQANPAAAQSPSAESTAPSNDELQSDIDEVRLLLSEHQSYVDRAFDMVYWATNIAGLVALAIIGYNIFQSRWAEPEARRSAMREIREDLSSTLDARLNEISEANEQFRHDIRADTDKHREDQEYLSRASRTELSGELTIKLDQYRTFAEARASQSDEAMMARFNDLSRSLKQMQHDLLKDSLDSAIRANGFVSVYQAEQLLQLALELERDPPFPDFQVTTALRLLREAIPRNWGLDDREINSVNALLDQLPDKYRGSRDSIRPMLVYRELDPSQLFPRAPLLPSSPQASPTDWAGDPDNLLQGDAPKDSAGSD